ncbi:MAG: hypothetical protein IKH13_07905 [Clostridia bacterium]|nr:hypothetical protein [Clostridia bacterium]
MREKSEKWREKSKNAELFEFSRVCRPASEKILGSLEKYGANGSEQEASKYHQKTGEFQSVLRLEMLCAEMHLGFESLTLRQKALIRKRFGAFSFFDPEPDYCKIKPFFDVFLHECEKTGALSRCLCALIYQRI